MKKRQKQNIAIAIAAVVGLGAIIVYNSNVEQTKAEGFAFGNELKEIQDELKKLQTDFESDIRIWKEGDSTDEEFFESADKHISKMKQLVVKYETLSPPETFTPAVEFFKLSTLSQIESDEQFIEWLKTGDESNKIRSDKTLQEAFDYEMVALTKYNEAKQGIIP